jgi:type IV secretory pathway TrbL component
MFTTRDHWAHSRAKKTNFVEGENCKKVLVFVGMVCYIHQVHTVDKQVYTYRLKFNAALGQATTLSYTQTIYYS